MASRNEFFETAAKILATFSLDDRVRLMRWAAELSEARSSQKRGSVVKLRLVKPLEPPAVG